MYTHLYTNVPGALDELPLLRRHRLTVADYCRMAEAGVPAPGARLEIFEGG